MGWGSGRCGQQRRIDPPPPTTTPLLLQQRRGRPRCGDGRRTAPQALASPPGAAAIPPPPPACPPWPVWTPSARLQDKQYLTNAINKLAVVKPDVLLVEKTVARTAQEDCQVLGGARARVRVCVCVRAWLRYCA